MQKFYLLLNLFRAHFGEVGETEVDYNDPSSVFVAARKLFEQNLFDAVDMMGVAAGVVRMKNKTDAPAINLEQPEDLAFLKIIENILSSKDNIDTENKDTLLGKNNNKVFSLKWKLKIYFTQLKRNSLLIFLSF